MTGASLRDLASRASHGALVGLRHPATIASAYAAVAIVTFGYSASDAYRQSSAEYAKCTHDRQRAFCLNDASFNGVAKGMGAAVLWPLYWSWELQQ